MSTERVQITPDDKGAGKTNDNPPGVRIDDRGRAVVDPDERLRSKNEESNAGGEERPAWLPEKFKTPQELAKAYDELESKLGTGGEPNKDEGKPDKNDKPGQLPSGDEDITAVLDRAGLDPDTIGREWDDNGELSKSSYEALQKQGYPRAIVDAVIRDRINVRDARDNELREIAGGPERTEAVLGWAKANLSAQEVRTYNTLLASNDPVSAKLAMQQLVQAYNAANPSEPAGRVTGTTTSRVGSGVQPFASNAEVTAAMKDPRYRTDPAYRDEVKRRLSVSKVM